MHTVRNIAKSPSYRRVSMSRHDPRYRLTEIPFTAAPAAMGTWVEVVIVVLMPPVPMGMSYKST